MNRLHLASGEAQRSFFGQNILVHTHIEKSAGSSLVAAFVDLFGAEHVHDLRPDSATRPRDMPARDKAGIWVLSGHFPYHSMDSSFDRQRVYIAAVRDPVARFLSHYRFVKASPHHPAYPAIHDKSAEQLIAQLIAQDHPIVVNDMSRSLGVLKPADIASQFEENYAIVAPFERVDELIEALYRIFGRQNAPTIRYNVGSGETVGIDRNSRLLFQSRNQIDTALCEYVNQRFDAWLKDLEERLCRVRRADAARSAPLSRKRLDQWWNCIVKERTVRTG